MQSNDASVRESTPIQESLFGFPEFDWNNPCDLNPEQAVEPFIGRSSSLTQIHHPLPT
jgi:hypothetical protein